MTIRKSYTNHFNLEKSSSQIDLANVDDANLLGLLLLQCGDVESNPGPPRRQPAAPAKTTPSTPEDKALKLEEKVSDTL